MRLVTLVSLAAMFAAPAALAGQTTTAPVKPVPANPPPGQDAGQPTSDRTPGKRTMTPDEQTTSVDGKTSDRTPEKTGEGSSTGAGAGTSGNAAGDPKYNSEQAPSAPSK